MLGKKLPPGPTPYPIFGNLLQLSDPPFFSLGKMAEKYGDVMMVWFGKEPAVVLSSPQAMKLFYLDNGRVFNDRPHSFIFDYVSNHFQYGFVKTLSLYLITQLRNIRNVL